MLDPTVTLSLILSDMLGVEIMENRTMQFIKKTLYFLQVITYNFRGFRMSLSKYESTQETTNFARVARIISGPCTDVLRAVLTKDTTPPNLIKNVKTYIAHNKKPTISKQQEKLINQGNFFEFDITLLYFLFRNISSIKPHSKQWGNEPDPSDRSVSANIERIRSIRNDYVHKRHPSTSKSDFEREWKNIFRIVKELGRPLGSSTALQVAMTEIKMCSMDPEAEQSYIQKLRIVENLQEDVNILKGKTLLKRHINLHCYTYLI